MFHADSISPWSLTFTMALKFDDNCTDLDENKAHLCQSHSDGK